MDQIHTTTRIRCTSSRTLTPSRSGKSIRCVLCQWAEAKESLLPVLSIFASAWGLLERRYQQCSGQLNFHKMFVGLTGDAFTSVHAADILDGIIMAVVKLLFPTRKDPNDPNSLLWISGAQDFLTGMDYGINTPMQGSLLHTRMQKKGLLRSHIDIGASLADEKNLLVTRQHKMLPNKEERIR